MALAPATSQLRPLGLGKDRFTLPTSTQQALRHPAVTVHFSAASLWEIAIKCSLGRQDFTFQPQDIEPLAQNGLLKGLRLAKGRVLAHGRPSAWQLHPRRPGRCTDRFGPVDVAWIPPVGQAHQQRGLRTDVAKPA